MNTRRISVRVEYLNRVGKPVGHLFNPYLGNLFQVFARADDLDLKFGMTAYEEYQGKIKMIAAPFNVDGRTACGIFAALSPNIDEAANFLGLQRILEGAYDASVPGYPINKDKARQILRGAHPLDVLNGLKTRAFFANLNDPANTPAVVVDAHIHACWKLERMGVTQSYLPPKLYTRIADDIRTAARVIGMRPNQLQATLWTTWKRVNDIVYDGHQRKLFGD